MSSTLQQSPAPGEYLLRWRGDALEVSLSCSCDRPGRAVCRTEIGGGQWHDVPLTLISPGRWRAVLPLDEVGIFHGKCCFILEGADSPEWPEGDNFTVKVAPADTRSGNAIYTVFPRQFGSFREVARRLDFIMGEMGFNIIQTLPVFPVPVTYAVMGEYGCPFAATDFFSVDPAMAEFDERPTPLDQFRELVDDVHAR